MLPNSQCLFLLKHRENYLPIKLYCHCLCKDSHGDSMCRFNVTTVMMTKLQEAMK